MSSVEQRTDDTKLVALGRWVRSIGRLPSAEEVSAFEAGYDAAALREQPEARGVVDASILQEAGDVLEAIGTSGVALPANWRWPLADELHGMAAALTPPGDDAAGGGS